MKIKRFAAILFGKWLFCLLRLLRRGGTYLPGKAALWLCPDILSYISQNVETILVTGTNGKTTTVNMIAQMLKAECIPYIATVSGGNIKSSITTEYIRNYDLFRQKPKTALAVIECDEKYVPVVLPEVLPRAVVVTNILKDQTDRLGTEEDVFRLFCKAMLDSDAVFCLDETEAYGKRLIAALAGKNIVPYSVSGKVGQVCGKQIDLPVHLQGEYNYKNAMAACAALYAQQRLTENAIKTLKTVSLPFGRMERADIAGVSAILNLSKNESGVYGALRAIASEGKAYTVVLGFNAQVEDGRDTSWIGEINWKQYSDILSDVLVSGECSVVTRRALSKNGLPSRNISGYSELLKKIQSSEKPVFLMMNYTFMMKFRGLLAKKGYVKDFWKT